MKHRRIVSATVALSLLGALSVSFYKQKYPKLVGSDESQDHDLVADTEKASSDESEAISKVLSTPHTEWSFSVISEAIASNDPDVLKTIGAHDPEFKTRYGDSEWSLLHMASHQCSPEIVKALHSQGHLNWDIKAKDGTTPLTIAADVGCSPVLNYFKSIEANFSKNDGRGKSALSILKHNENKELLSAFSSELERRKPASVKQVAEVSFYRKRTYPSAPIVDKRSISDSNSRPTDLPETADFTEFAD
jgi:ankyrin repeat protein